MNKTYLHNLNTNDLKDLYFKCAKIYRLSTNKKVKVKVKSTAYVISNLLLVRGEI